jgi:hypothetical protein
MNNDITIDNFEETLDEDFYINNPIYKHFSIDIAPESRCGFENCSLITDKLKEMRQGWPWLYKKHVYDKVYWHDVKTLLQAKQIAFSFKFWQNPFTTDNKKIIGKEAQDEILMREIRKYEDEMMCIAEELKIFTCDFEEAPSQDADNFTLRSEGHDLYKLIEEKRKKHEILQIELGSMRRADEIKKEFKKTNNNTEDNGFLTLEEALLIPEKVWMIDQIIGKHDIGVIYGASGLGKTFITLDLIMSACTGTKFAGSFDVKDKLNVAYCAGEGKSGIPARLSAVIKKHEINPKELTNFTLVTWAPQLFLTEEKSAKEFIERWKLNGKQLDLVVIDTFHTATNGAEENSTRDMGLILQSCKMITEALNCAIILIHHSEKTGVKERGNISLRCGSDLMIQVVKEKMVCSKLKDGEHWHDIAFQLKAMKGLTSCSVDWLGKAESKKKEPENMSTVKEDKSEASAIKKVLNLFESKKGQFFTSKEIAEFLGSSSDCRFSNKILNQINDSGLCITSNETPSKPTSTRNPKTYSYREHFN